MFDIITDIKYNVSQSSLKVMFVKYAKRTQKIQIYIRSHRPNPLGRACSFQPVLQIHWSQTFSADLCPLACLLSQDLSSGRCFPGSYLCYCHRHRKNSKYPITDSQRAHSADPGATRVPTSGHVEDFSLEIQLPKPPKPTTSPRQVPERTLFSSGTALFCHHRRGYDSPDCLWPSRVSQYGLQSQIPWEAFLRSAYFQRRQNRPFAFAPIKSWQYPSCKRGMGIFRTYHRKTSFHYGLIQNSHSSGCLFLQQGYHTAFRREKYWLRHCFQNAQISKVADTFRPLPRICQRLGGSRICLSGLKFQKRTSFYCHQTTNLPRTRGGPKKSFYLPKLCLSQGLSHQLRYQSRSSMAILLQQRLSRTPASGIQKFPFHGSNSNQKFLGKRCLHGNDPLGIRFGFGFPTSMSAKGNSTLEYFNASQRTLVVTSAVGQACQPQYSMVSQAIPTTRFVFQDSKSNFKGQTFNLGQFANMFYRTTDEKHQKSNVYSRFSGRVF